MDIKEATRTCGQCHKEIAEVNFALHETHCSRFLCLCPDCDEPVPREQLNQHREEQHTVVRCSKCNKKVERGHLKDHESDDCVERLQSCQFCELELPWKELDEHHVVCGSRTELCRDCNRYVTLKDQPQHGLTCSATDNASGPPQTANKPPPNKSTQITVSCSRCTASFPAEDIEEHELECVSATRLDDEDAAPEEEEEEEEEDEDEDEGEGEDEGDFSGQGDTTWLNSAYKSTSLSNGPSRGPWGGGGNPDQISTCPHCHLALPLITLRWHTVKCQVYINLK